uniref:Uncharacterized protein n=1 Tax=Anguilla anguilla TaxID=7936 RepID=A0A0E9SA60_ANGAN
MWRSLSSKIEFLSPQTGNHHTNPGLPMCACV